MRQFRVPALTLPSESNGVAKPTDATGLESEPLARTPGRCALRTMVEAVAQKAAYKPALARSFSEETILDHSRYGDMLEIR
jgi:hypothetical protein